MSALPDIASSKRVSLCELAFYCRRRGECERNSSYEIHFARRTLAAAAMAYASSRHTAWRLTSAVARVARAPAVVAPLEPAIARPSSGACFSRGFAGASASAGGSAGGGRFRSVLGAAFLLSPSMVCVGLCKWQLDRWEWKKNQLVSREAALGEGERGLHDVLDAMARGEEIEEYTAVIVEGTLDLKKSVRVAPRVRSVHGSPMAGAALITAMSVRPKTKGWFSKTPEKQTVLVNRGWVPVGWEDSSGGLCLKSKGVTRVSEIPGRFTPHNDENTKQFHWVDVRAVASALGLPLDTPLVQLTHGGRADQGNAAPTSFPAPTALADLRTFRVTPTDHVSYAATWGGLAIATGGGALYALNARRRGIYRSR